MAPRANRLADIGREGFDLVDRFYGGGTSNQVPKKQYNAPQQYAPDHSNQTWREGFDLVDRFYGGGTSNQVPKKQYNAPQQCAPDHSNQTVINSKKAAEKYKGVAGYLDAHVSSNENIINNNKAAEIYGGVVITEYYKKRFVDWPF